MRSERLLETLLIGFLCLFLLGFGNPTASKNNKANKLYAEENYEEALKLYRDAQLEDPESPPLHFNIGDVLYKSRKYDQAIEEYQKALSAQDAELEAKVHYNIGNAYFRQDRLIEAIQSYKRSLELNPDDIDAKFNLELAQAKLKERTEIQQQEMQAGQEQQEQQEQEGQEGQEEKEQEKQSEMEAQEEKEQQTGEAQEGEMTREEAERILNALKDEEKEAQKKRRVVMPGGRRVGKDW